MKVIDPPSEITGNQIEQSMKIEYNWMIICFAKRQLKQPTNKELHYQIEHPFQPAESKFVVIMIRTNINGLI